MSRSNTKEIKQEKGWSISDMATATNTATSTVYKNLEGSYFKISNQILVTLDEMGYNTKKISDQYQEFRKEKAEKLIS